MSLPPGFGLDRDAKRAARTRACGPFGHKYVDKPVDARNSLQDNQNVVPAKLAQSSRMLTVRTTHSEDCAWRDGG